MNLALAARALLPPAHSNHDLFFLHERRWMMDRLLFIKGMVRCSGIGMEPRETRCTEAAGGRKKECRDGERGEVKRRMEGGIF